MTQQLIDSLTNVRNSIALKLNIADTAAMLAPYAIDANTAADLALKLNIAVWPPYRQIFSFYRGDAKALSEL